LRRTSTFLRRLADLFDHRLAFNWRAAIIRWAAVTPGGPRRCRWIVNLGVGADSRNQARVPMAQPP